MDYSEIVAFAGVLIYLGAFGFYNREILAGRSKPNMATWMLWAFLAGFNAATYQSMSGDWVKTIQAYGGSIANIGTFLFALHRGKLSGLTKLNWLLLTVGFLSMGVWWISRDAKYANLILQACITISIIPTWMGVYQDPKIESPLPWFLLSAAYAFAIAVVIMRWQGQIQDLVFPINCMVIQLIVAILACGKRGASFWMSVSGITGFGLFIIANLTDIFTNLNLLAGCLQIIVNFFVFVTWRRGYLVHTGLKKIVALIGTIVPVIMATTTIIRVLIPAIIAIAK